MARIQRTYLSRMNLHDDDMCDCGAIETPEHVFPLPRNGERNPTRSRFTPRKDSGGHTTSHGHVILDRLLNNISRLAQGRFEVFFLIHFGSFDPNKST